MAGPRTMNRFSCQERCLANFAQAPQTLSALVRQGTGHSGLFNRQFPDAVVTKGSQGNRNFVNPTGTDEVVDQTNDLFNQPEALNEDPQALGQGSSGHTSTDISYQIHW